MQQWKAGVLGGITCIFALGTYASYKYFKRNSKKYNSLITNLPKDVSQYKKMKNKKPGDVVVIRATHDLNNPKKQTRDFYSNQESFGFPDQRYYCLQKVIDQQSKLQNESWRVYDIYDFKNSMHVKSFGSILDGVLEINVQAIKTITFKQQPFYKKFWIVLTFGLEWILEALYALFGGRYKQQIAFKGAKIGYFDLTFNWFKGHLLLQCEIGNDGTPEVQAISLSNDLLIQNASRRQSITFYLFMICAGISLLTLYHFIKSYRIVKQKHDRQAEGPQRYRQLNFQPNQQIQTCIICMTNNRNIIFSNCGHLVICSMCLPMYNTNECPLCKSPINIKRVYAIE